MVERGFVYLMAQNQNQCLRHEMSFTIKSTIGKAHLHSSFSFDGLSTKTKIMLNKKLKIVQMLGQKAQHNSHVLENKIIHKSKSKIVALFLH